MAKKRAKRKPKRTKVLTDQIRQAIDDSGFTRYRIAKETGMTQTALALFYHGHRGLSMQAMNAIGEFLKLKIELGHTADDEGK